MNHLDEQFSIVEMDEPILTITIDSPRPGWTNSPTAGALYPADHSIHRISHAFIGFRHARHDGKSLDSLVDGHADSVHGFTAHFFGFNQQLGLGRIVCKIAHEQIFV